MRRFIARAACAALIGSGMGAVGTSSGRSAVHAPVAGVVQAGGAPTLRMGSRGPWVRTLQTRLGDLTYHVCWWYQGRCQTRFKIGVDGVFGPATKRAVQMFQAQEGLHRDGIVGPKTWAHLYAPTDPCVTAMREIAAAGATSREAPFILMVARRESGCRVNQVVVRPSTGDDSWGAFGINYSADMGLAGRADPSAREYLGPKTANTVTWTSGTAMILKLGRERGWCHWMKEQGYCKGPRGHRGMDP